MKTFNQKLDAVSRKKNSKIILALDIDHRTDTSRLLADSKRLIEKVSDHICAVKINYHLLLPLSISQLSLLNTHLMRFGLVSIADIKLNDIGNTNRVALNYLWDSGFSSVIVNPVVGYEGALDVVFDEASRRHKGVITLAYMSHKGADEYYGLRLENGKTMFDLFLKRAIEWKSSGVILGTTRPAMISIARKILGDEIKIICPGSGAQGGDVVESMKAGAQYIIVGRSIVDSSNPVNSARFFRLLASRATD